MPYYKTPINYPTGRISQDVAKINENFTELANSFVNGDPTTYTVINSDKVDNYHASQTPSANTIPVAGADGKLNAGWLPFVLSLTDNGYIKFPNGLIIQWGKVSINVSGIGWVTGVLVTYPIVFPNAVFTVVLFRDNLNTADVVISDPRLQGAPALSFFRFDFHINLIGVTGVVNWYWIAIGY